MKTIAQLEAASDAACEAHDKALARLAKLDTVIAALTIVSDEQDASDLDDGDRKILWHLCASTPAFELRARRAELLKEIDRLEMLCHEAAHELNSAPEEAA